MSHATVCQLHFTQFLTKGKITFGSAAADLGSAAELDSAVA